MTTLPPTPAPRFDTSSQGPRKKLEIHATRYAEEHLQVLDQKLIGTNDYLGLAGFWAWEYRDKLRACTPAQRIAVHDRWLTAGLALTGESEQHRAIFDDVVNQA